MRHDKNLPVRETKTYALLCSFEEGENAELRSLATSAFHPTS